MSLIARQPRRLFSVRAECWTADARGVVSYGRKVPLAAFSHPIISDRVAGFETVNSRRLATACTALERFARLLYTAGFAFTS